jgi:hypothetical protein
MIVKRSVVERGPKDFTSFAAPMILWETILAFPAYYLSTHTSPDDPTTRERGR